MSNPLEEYLNKFRSQLKNLPQEQRDAEVEETRQHLQALIQQRVEKGESPEAATVAAIAQFGSARDNGQALRKMWQGEFGKLARFLSFTHWLCVAVLMFSIVTDVTGWPYRFTGYWHGRPVYWGHTLGYLSSLPITLFPHSNFVLISFVLFAAIALSSLTFVREVRTIFFGVFALLVGSALTLELFVPGYSHYLSTPEQYISYIWKAALLVISTFGLFVSLWRDKSLVSMSRKKQLI